MSHIATFDAIIVGAGPAGSATALLLARAGHHVVLLDRHSFPRPKPCGDCLSAAATSRLARLGVLARIEAAGPARLSGWRIVSPGGWEFVGEFAAAGRDPHPPSALSLPREQLDSILADAARSHGAELRTGVYVTDLLRDRQGRVTGVTGREPDGAPVTLEAPLVIGADGIRSIIARRIGAIRRPPRLRKISLTAHLSGIRDVDDHGEMHLAAGACAGLAPVRAPAPGTSAMERLCNLTIVVDADGFAHRIAGDAKTFFHTMIRRFPRLAGRIDRLDRATAHHPSGSAPLSPPLLASGPFDWATRGVVAGGVALVGDAAGYFDPFTGQGIHQALTDAEILAEVADAALRAGDTSARRLRDYARRRRPLIRGARALQHFIETVVSRPRLADAAVRHLGRAPTAADALIAAAGDLRPARTLLSPAVTLAFVFRPILPGGSR